jgi:hypothetical protein
MSFFEGELLDVKQRDFKVVLVEVRMGLVAFYYVMKFIFKNYLLYRINNI